MINLNSIIKRISEYSIETNVVNNCSIMISDIQFLEYHQKSFDSSILYIVEISNFPKSLPTEGTINILCVSNVSTSKYLSIPESLNLIFVKNTDIDVGIIFNQIHHIFKNEALLYLNKEKLFKCLLEKESMQKIVNLAYEILGNPVVIVDRGCKVLACTDIKLKNEFWDNIIYEKRYFDSDYTISVKTSKEMHKCLMSKTPSICIKPNYPRNFISSIFIENKLVASIGLLEICNSFSEKESKILSFMSEILSIEMQKSKYNYINKGLIFEYFLNDLLEDKIYDDNEIKNRIVYSEINLKKFNYVFTIDTSTYKDNNIDNLIIIDDLSLILNDTISFPYHSYIVTLISIDSYLINNSSFKDLEKYLKRRKLSGGLSLCFNYLGDMKKYFIQSKKALELSQHLNENKVICIYEEYAYHHLLEISSKFGDITSICHPSIFILIDYDKKNGTELLKSLFLYVKFDKSITLAANELHVHRNTLNSRITKIKSIIDINWENNEVIKYIYLSLRILEYNNNFSFEGKYKN
ncbi:PucR family transcriptional regulator [Alkalibaculum sporogenes]|nr:helix-turn-helix domain-containing protein [Alkalibaculum sporogenes]